MTKENTRKPKQTDNKGYKAINNYDDDSIVFLEKYSNIITSTTEKNNKTYNTYQLNMPLDFIDLIVGAKLRDKQVNFYLKEIDKKIFQIIAKEQTNIIDIIKNDDVNIDAADDISDDLIKINIRPNYTTRLIHLTLPKKRLDILQAYEKYLQIINNVNIGMMFNNIADDVEANADADAHFIDNSNTIELYPIGVKISLVIENNPAGKDLNKKLYFYLDTKVDDNFVEYTKKVNDNIVPSWLKMLI